MNTNHDHENQEQENMQSHNDNDGGEQTGHEEMFRRKFWISLILSMPVLIFSETVQNWLNYSLPQFYLSDWIVPVFSIIIFYIGGLPFFRMARGELKKRQPGMMTLISMALSVAFIYSLGSTFFNLGQTFYWELVTLIGVMLLGHWIEIRSVRQTSGAFQELSALLPDTAELITENGETETVKVSTLDSAEPDMGCGL